MAKTKAKPITAKQLGEFITSFARTRNVAEALKLAGISETSVKSRQQTFEGQMVQTLINGFGDSYEWQIASNEERKTKHKKRRKLTSKLVRSDE